MCGVNLMSYTIRYDLDLNIDNCEDVWIEIKNGSSNDDPNKSVKNEKNCHRVYLSAPRFSI